MDNENVEMTVEVLKAIANTLSEVLEDAEFCLHVMPKPLDKSGGFAFISNASRKDVITVLEENLKILKENEMEVFKTYTSTKPN